MKERLLENTMKIIDIMCVWDCCWLWIQIQKFVALIVFDPFMELFITLCIVVNTLFMALDHHNMDKDLERALKSGNYVRKSNHFSDSCLKLCFSVFYCDLFNRGYDEACRNEPKILLPRGMEYLRFYNRSLVSAGTCSGRCTRIIRVEIVPIGKLGNNL